jgi:hypothetical protein
MVVRMVSGDIIVGKKELAAVVKIVRSNIFS